VAYILFTSMAKTTVILKMRHATYKYHRNYDERMYPKDGPWGKWGADVLGWWNDPAGPAQLCIETNGGMVTLYRCNILELTLQ